MLSRNYPRPGIPYITVSKVKNSISEKRIVDPNPRPVDIGPLNYGQEKAISICFDLRKQRV